MPIIDLVACFTFLSVWSLYTFIVDVIPGKKSRNNLVTVMHQHRLQWMQSMAQREERLADIRVIGNFTRTTSFLASTSILMVAGSITLLGYGKEALQLMHSIPWIVPYSLEAWSYKSVLLLVVFIYSFFKFTWVIRQFNYVSVVIMGMPYYGNKKPSASACKALDVHIENCATILSNAARHFNMAIRSYYFGLVALSWFISPIMLIVMSLLVVVILYRREFMSRTLELLR